MLIKQSKGGLKTLHGIRKKLPFSGLSYILFSLMATKKAGGSTKNGRDSNPKYLGVKINHGDIAHIGEIIVRQRGTECGVGQNVGLGKDHTIFALKEGIVEFKNKRKMNFDGSRTTRKQVNVK